MISLTGKTVLLTGASKGIGAATAEALGSAGAYVVAHYGSDKAGVVHATKSIPAERKLIIQADFAEPEGARILWSQALSWRGRIDALINNAAIMPEDRMEVADEGWDQIWAEVMQVNVFSYAVLMREAIKHYKDHEGGVIVTMSSQSGLCGAGNPNLTAYAASKAAVRAATQTIARAHAAEGVLAFIVAPGVVRTRMSVDSARSVGGEDLVTAQLPTGRWIEPAEVADLLCFLVSGTCPQLTGATLDINGARYIR